MKLTIVIPCLNEASTLPRVISEAHEMASKLYDRTEYEIIVADNGSRDGSRETAEKNGARVEDVAHKGYGAALRGGLSAAEGEVIVMADADGSYDFREADEMVKMIEEKGYGMVIGDRFGGRIEKGAMPWTHRYIGVPILSALGRIRYNTEIKDFHCGLRAISKSVWSAISQECDADGMEFATEMIGKAVKKNTVIGQVPITLRRDFRPEGQKPHLRTIPDGWRHIKEIFFSA